MHLSADGPILYPSSGRLAAGAGRAADPVEPSDRAATTMSSIEIEITDEREAMAHFDMQSYEQLAARRHRAREAQSPADTAASGRLQLLRDAAAEAALERDAERVALARLRRVHHAAFAVDPQFRDRRGARPGFRVRVHSAERRNRGRKVDPDRRPAACAWRTRRRRRRARGRAARRNLGRVSPRRACTALAGAKRPRKR